MTEPNLFQAALQRTNSHRPPVWMMRQAGRYHSHYQGLRKTYSFLDLCKIPSVSVEAALGPVNDFGFDAAILFSDLLFPLEVMGMPLSYETGGPKLGWKLDTLERTQALKDSQTLASSLRFQSEALHLLRNSLAPEKGLLGFVGGPATLYCYAVDGSHKGSLEDSKRGLKDGRYSMFCNKLRNLLAQNMADQFQAGADVIAVLDTCAGEFSLEEYQSYLLPELKLLFQKFNELCPSGKLLYYSKKTQVRHFEWLADLPQELLSGIGVDWNVSLPSLLTTFSDRFCIQGGFNPELLFLNLKELEGILRSYFESILKLPTPKRRGWICGLGHGILPKTPEDSVRLFIKLEKEYFGAP